MRKKLIEVALPLEAINLESGREKAVRPGHPSVLHLWWARRPLAACRAVLWASLVDDPSSWPERFPTEADQARERQRLFDILGRVVMGDDGRKIVKGLVSWEEVNDPQTQVLVDAQREIARSIAWGRGEEPPTDPDAVREYIAKHCPPVYDPFSGGGSIPFEAQRLGVRAYGSDLNPVAVTIGKALLEIPLAFNGYPAVNPESRGVSRLTTWRGALGLATDLRYYGRVVRDRAYERIGDLFPKVHSPSAVTRGGKPLTVAAWLWARTVQCPSCGYPLPLLHTFKLSDRRRRKATTTWVRPIIDRSQRVIHFEVHRSKTVGTVPLDGTVNRYGATCLSCGGKVPLDYVRHEGREGRMGRKMIAIVCVTPNGKGYLSPDPDHEKLALSIEPPYTPELLFPLPRQGYNVTLYGMRRLFDLFTPRQLVALKTFSELVTAIREQVYTDAIASGMSEDPTPLAEGGRGARAYAEAVSVYLAFAIDRGSDYWSTNCSWKVLSEEVRHAFAMHTLPMIWDFAETNPFSDVSGSWWQCVEGTAKVLERLDPRVPGNVYQHDAASPHTDDAVPKIISTDPPYFNNVYFSYLSDYFYVWLRQQLQTVYPRLYEENRTPKHQELVPDPNRFGGDKTKAHQHFEDGFRRVFHRLRQLNHPEYPLTVYYAFKNAKTTRNADGTFTVSSTGWESMLEGLTQAQYQITGVWPLRTELGTRINAVGSTALASSIVLVCRPRPHNAPTTTYSQFEAELRAELDQRVRTLQRMFVPPSDIPQAIIGIGMSVFTRYTSVWAEDGTHIRVGDVLRVSNRLLDEYYDAQSQNFDVPTQWAITWLKHHAFEYGGYDEAERLAQTMDTSVEKLVALGVVSHSEEGIRLWSVTDPLYPELHPQSPVWVQTQALANVFHREGATATARLIGKLTVSLKHPQETIEPRVDPRVALAYVGYHLCERLQCAKACRHYNDLFKFWADIQQSLHHTESGQMGLPF